MVTATMTSKGQLTIPKEVRNKLHLRAGDRVAFEVHDDCEALLKPITKSVDEVFGSLRRPGQPHRSLKDMKRAVVKRMQECSL